MAEVLLRDLLLRRGIDGSVSSAGELRGGVHATSGAVRAMTARGLDLREHVSRTMNRDELQRSDLVLAMARRHLRNAVALAPATFERTFTLKELARRGTSVGPRRRGQSLSQWLEEVHRGRTTVGLLGDDPRDDVEDPIGGPDTLYERTACEIADLLEVVVDLAFAGAERRETA